jgi:16S rRNA pseudouridine516 synthase
MQIAHLLFTQGFGTRRECAGLVAAGHVRMDGRVVDDPGEDVPAVHGQTRFEVDARPWLYLEKALVLLHKPAGYECSQKPRHHPSVLALLPPPLRTRGVQPVGRLDEDTTGLLLLTDDGTLIHRLTSPKKVVPKVYEATTKHPVTEAQLQALRDGVVLRGEPGDPPGGVPVRAAGCEAAGEHLLRLTLTEGKYHQVKRMVAAAGNRVQALHRSAFGALVLPPDLAPGQWRFLPEGLAAVTP